MLTNLDIAFEVEDAKAIIESSLKSKGRKLLTEFSGWDKLSHEAKDRALKEMICPICKKVAVLSGIHSFIYEKVACCDHCDDKNQFPHLLATIN